MDDSVVRPWRRRRRRWRHRRRRRPIAQRRAGGRLPSAVEREGERESGRREREREGGVNVTPRRPEHGFARREQNEPEIFALSRSSPALKKEEGGEEKFLFRCCFSLFSFSLPINEWRGKEEEPSSLRSSRRRTLFFGVGSCFRRGMKRV